MVANRPVEVSTQRSLAMTSNHGVAYMGIVREGEPKDAKGPRRRPTCACRQNEGGEGGSGDQRDWPWAPQSASGPASGESGRAQVPSSLWPAMTLQDTVDLTHHSVLCFMPCLFRMLRLRLLYVERDKPSERSCVSSRQDQVTLYYQY